MTGSCPSGRGLYLLFFIQGYLAVPSGRKSFQSSSALFYFINKMKQHYIKTIFLCLSLLAGTTTAIADAVKIDGIYYNLVSKMKIAEVTSNPNDDRYYKGYYKGAVNIPDNVVYEDKTYSVTSIGNDAFCYCSGLTSITIPNSVTSIGDRAFHDCSRLTSITIPESVTSIGDNAFDSSGLTSVTIPNSVTSISDGAFEDCSSLTSVTIPNSVTSIGWDAFYGCI